MTAFLTVAETAAYLRVSPMTVRREIRAGRLRAARVGSGNGIFRIAAGDLDRYVAACDTDLHPEMLTDWPERAS